MDLSTLIDSLRFGLIVSCQALPGEPLFGSGHMVAMARAAVLAGAVAVRINGPADIAAVRAELDVPIIGLYKADLPDTGVRITPTLAYAVRVAEAGADLVAVDATNRPHPEGSAAQLIEAVRLHTGIPVLADVSTLAEGLDAAAAGAGFVATTLSGYTAGSPPPPGPDFTLLEQLAAALAPRRVPVIAEGRIADPEQAVQALRLGAHAVVVGSAITRPQWIAARFMAAMRAGRQA